MNKTGIVIEINDADVGILTPSGEFAYVKRNSKPVTLGELYCEEILTHSNKKNINVKRILLAAASFLLLILLSSGIFLYNEPVSAVTIDINPSIELYVNRWNKIIRVIPLNNEGKNLVNELNLKNLDISNGIDKIYEKCKTQNYINEDYKKDKAINIQVSNFKNNQLDLSKIERKIEEEGINIRIDNIKDKEIKKDSNSDKSTSPKEKENNLKNEENNDIKEENDKTKENDTHKNNNFNNKNIPEQKNNSNFDLNQKDNSPNQSKNKDSNDKNSNKDNKDKNNDKEKDKKR